MARSYIDEMMGNSDYSEKDTKVVKFAKIFILRYNISVELRHKMTRYVVF